MTDEKNRKPTAEEAEAILTLVRGGWLRLELTLDAEGLPVTAPLLASRDALAEVDVQHGPVGFVSSREGWIECECGERLSCEVDRDGYSKDNDAEKMIWARHRADALLASGVVRDPATLADDEALSEVVWGALDADGHNGIECRPGKPMDYTADAIMRALAAALTEDRP